MNKDKRPLLFLLIPLLLMLLGYQSYTAPGKFTPIQVPEFNTPRSTNTNPPESTPEFILPELPLGPITALISMITAMVLLSKRPIIQK
jgi:hypothetical protein